MAAVSSLRSIPPIATVHSGPVVAKFPSSKEEQATYELSQRILTAQVEGEAVARYPESLTDHWKTVHITEMGPPLVPASAKECENTEYGKTAKVTRGRSLRASRVIGSGKCLAAFKGRILNQKQFEDAVPIQAAGDLKTVPLHYLCKDHSTGTDAHDYIIRDKPEMRARDIAHLRCRILKLDKKKKTADVSLYGFRDTHHMLTVTPGTYICPSVSLKTTSEELPALKKGHEYLWGLGTIANTKDSPFGDGSGHNAKFYVSRTPPSAILVSSRRLEKDEEIFTSYEPKSFRVFKTQEDLWATLGLAESSSSSEPPPAPVKKSKRISKAKKAPH